MRITVITLLCVALASCTAQQVQTVATVCDIAAKALGCIAGTMPPAK